MSRDAVLDGFGAPDSERTLVKDTEAVWGPIEDFWAHVPMGATVEIWYYPSETRSSGIPPERIGTTELYFVDDSATVDGIGFAPEGVDYETGAS